MATKQQLAHSLTSEELSKLLPFEVEIVHYSDLQNYSNIFELLHPNNAVILFFESSRDNNSLIGHYTCITISPKSRELYTQEELESGNLIYTINYFDSYGSIPDNEKKSIPKEYLQMTDQRKNFLTKLLYDAAKRGVQLEYNEVPLQKLSPDINTCGRYCALKILTKDSIPLEDFQDWFKTDSFMTADEKTVILTEPVLKGIITPEKLQSKLVEIIINDQELKEI